MTINPSRKLRPAKYGRLLPTSLHVRLDADQRTRLEKLAADFYGENISYVLREALEIALPVLEARYGPDGAGA